MAEALILDRERLAEIAGDDEEFAQEVLEAYLGEAAVMLTQLTTATPETVKAVAHQLKGASANVGALEVCRLALALEVEPSDVASLLPELQVAIARVQAAL